MNWLIKLLGGYPKYEMEKLSLTADSWRTRAIAAETTVELVKEIMTRERARADKMEERLAGPHPSAEQQTPPDFSPVGERRLSSWPRIKRELEKQNRVKPDAQVSREEIEKTIREG